MSRMAVLMFADYYLPGFKAGGPIRTIANMADQLDRFCSFQAITRDRDLGDSRPYPNVKGNAWQEVGNAKVMYLGPHQLRSAMLRRLICETSHDVLYLNSLFSSYFTIVPLLLRRLRLIPERPVVIAPRGELSPGALKVKYRKKFAYLHLARLSALYRDVIWQASGPLEEEHIRRWWGSRATVSIAPDLVGPVASKTENRCAKQAGVLKIVFLSRISRKKNLHGALRLLAKVSGQIEFHIFGPKEDAAYWSDCCQVIKELPNNIRVVDHGPLEHTQVPHVLRQYDLFFLPTLGENFGHVILEALLAGCPVLISDQTFWQGLEEKGVGWDLPLNDPEAFRRVLQRCVEMRDEEFQIMSRKAMEYGATVAEGSEALEMNRRLFEVAANRDRRAA